MRMRQQTFSRLLFLLIALWCLGFSVAPAIEVSLLGTNGLPQLYEGICHQDPGRSFASFGVPWAVCHRCSAIYLSFGTVAVFLLLRGRFELESLPRPSVIVALLVPVVLDAVTDLLGLRSADVLSRITTGSLTGAVLALVVIPLCFDALRKLSAIEPIPSPGGQDA